MATLLDIGLLKHFENLFPFLFVLVVVYAILTKVPSFKEKPAFAAILAFSLAIMTLLSGIASKTMNLMAPWFVILLVFIVIVMVAYQAFGIEEKTILKFLTEGEYRHTIHWMVLALLLMIFLGSLSKAISEEKGFAGLTKEGQVSTAGEEGGFFATIVHPKILGLALLMLVAMFTISKLAGVDRG